MTWHKLKQTTSKNLGTQWMKPTQKKQLNVAKGVFQTAKTSEKEGKGRPGIMRKSWHQRILNQHHYQCLAAMSQHTTGWLYSANWRPKAWKLRTEAYIHYPSAHADMSARATRNQILVLCWKPLKHVEISKETRSKMFFSKKVQTSIKENNLRIKRETKHSSWKTLLKKEGNKTISPSHVSDRNIVSKQPVLLGMEYKKCNSLSLLVHQTVLLTFSQLLEAAQVVPNL